MAGLRNVVGCEITDCTKMMAESREQALDRMIEDAQSKGANAIMGIHFTTSMIMQMREPSPFYGDEFGVWCVGIGRDGSVYVAGEWTLSFGSSQSLHSLRKY